MLGHLFKNWNLFQQDKINKDIVNDYKKFVGEKELDKILTKFNNSRFSLEKNGIK